MKNKQFRLIASIEYSSCGQEVSKILSIANDLSHYNLRLMAEILSLIPHLSTWGDLRSGGPRVHRIDVTRSSRNPSDALDVATSPAIKTKRGLIVPHRKY